jgi:disulfide oxidoreductase YuzD
MTHFMEWLESKVFEKYPQIDVNYRRKITDICANIKQIHSFPEIAELVFNKYTLSCFAGKVRGEQKSQIKHLF